MEPTPFEALLARLSRRERVAFVAALLTARGWAVDVDSPLIRASKDDRQQVVAVAREGFVSLPGQALPRAPVDVVVGVDADRTQRLATERDADAWDARALYDMARHGLDPVAADRVFDEHFSVTSEAVDPPFTSDATDTATDSRDVTRGAEGSETAPRPRPDTSDADSPAEDALVGGLGRWDVPLLVVLLVVALFGGVFVAQALVGVSPTTPAAGDADAGSVDSGADTRLSATPVSTPTPELQPVLPGVTDSGITDTAALSRGHAMVLANRSFTMRITYTERVDGEAVGTAREVVRVENTTLYRSRGTESGDLVADLVPVIVRDLYADGESRYLRQGDDFIRVGNANESGTGQVVERSRALTAWYLSAERSALAGRVQQRNETYHRLVVEGTTERRFAEYRATSLVSEAGLVVRVEATYRLPESGRVATVSIQHVNVGNTTVDRPAWLPPEDGRAGTE